MGYDCIYSRPLSFYLLAGHSARKMKKSRLKKRREDMWEGKDLASSTWAVEVRTMCKKGLL